MSLLLALAVAAGVEGAPPVGDLTLVEAQSDRITLRWTVPTLPEGGRVSFYELLASFDGEITGENAHGPGVWLEDHLWDPAAGPGEPEEWTVALGFVLEEGLACHLAIRLYYDVEPLGAVFWTGPSNNVVAELDSVPPGAVGDLETVSADAGSLRMRWTAPGEDGGAGGISSWYEFRLSREVPGGDPDGWWTRAAPAAGPPAPAPPGTVQEFRISGLEPRTGYFVAVKSADEHLNWSPLSNMAGGVTTEEPAPASSGGGGTCGSHAAGTSVSGTLLLLAGFAIRPRLRS